MSSAVSKVLGPVVPGFGDKSASTVGMPSEDSAEVEAARETERRRAALRQGRSSTILTGGAGVEAGSASTLGG